MIHIEKSKIQGINVDVSIQGHGKKVAEMFCFIA